MALFCVCDYFHYAPAMWVTDENNRRIIGMLGREENKGNFQELQNRIIGKIKSILGSGLTTRSGDFQPCNLGGGS